METTPRVVPWQDWNEWMVVHSALFSTVKRYTKSQLQYYTYIYTQQTWQDRRWALDIISMWRERGRLPHSIDATASLTEACMNDSHSITREESPNTHSNNELRMLYSMAIIRGALFDIYH